MELKRNFIQGVMDRSSDNRLLPPGVVRDFLNVRVSSSEGGDVGAIENCLGNERLTELDLGDNAEAVGAGRDISLNTIFWLVVSDDRSCFIEYNLTSGTPTKILEDTRVGDLNILNLHKDNHITKINIIIDADNDKTYAFWNDNRNPPRFVSIERAKGYGENGFGQDEISLIKKPPSDRPTMTLTDSTTQKENNIEEKFLRFAYRYKYLDGEYSALSSFTEVAFLPEAFNYDYATNSNESMINSFNQVDLEFNTGSDLVTDIELIFKESFSNTVYRVEPLNKIEEGWGDNSDETIELNTNKLHKVLAPDEINRLYDNVPLKAETNDIIGSQIMMGQYTENYDLIKPGGGNVNVDMTLSYEAIAIADLVPKNSVKSIRDYEVGLVYHDEYKRMTSVLTSKNSSVFVDVADSDKENKLKLTISHIAPEFAVGFRIFIKQSKEHYDTLVVTLFYEDGVYVWIRLLGDERDKISKGDYLIVKSDSREIIGSYIETRVLEIIDQPVDFLDRVSEGLFQEAGTYFKIKPEGFRITPSDFENYLWKSYHDSEYAPAVIDSDNFTVFENAVYYGTTGLNDLEAGGAYTNSILDIRYIIQIDDTPGIDEFKWSDDDGGTFSANIPITAGVPQNIDNGITVTFIADVGHTIGDQWIISAKGRNAPPRNGNSIQGYSTQQRIAMVVLKGPPGDIIEGGARVTMIYDEFGLENLYVEKAFTSSTRYENLEEWYYGDNIDSLFGPQFLGYWFRRGKVTYVGGTRNKFSQFIEDDGGIMCMIIRSIEIQDALQRAKLEGHLKIFQSENNILFETKSLENNSEIYYEIGKTYILSEEGYHIGDVSVGDIIQSSVVPAVINLEFFNCFSWGNAFESYKIKDRFNAKEMGIDTRPHTTVDDYRENIRVGVTWSQVYNQTTQYNGLNEFNLSLVNFIPLDDAYGKIQRLHSRETDIVAYQENKIQPLGYRKSQLFDQAGNPSYAKSDKILSVLKSYTGEYGIGLNPESFAFFGNRLYSADTRRGSPLRVSQNGVTELSLHQMSDFFKDIFRAFPDARYEGGYDPYFDEYILSITTVGLNNEKTTIGFSENAKGWVSRYSYGPEKMVGINNNFYSFKEGQLWIHNSENVPRNNFYGIQYNSSVTLIFNESPSDDKIFKTINLEGNKVWDVFLETNLAKSKINKEEFELRESRYFSYTRRNEDINDKTSLSTIGIDEISEVNATIITFANEHQLLSEGDKLYQVNQNQEQLIGVIESLTKTTITVVSIINTPIVGNFCYAKKDRRIEGGNMRGYYMEAKLINSDIDKTELFSVGTKVAKSYV